MCVFRADHFVLDNQLVGKNNSPTLRIPYLPIVVCVGLRPSGISWFTFSCLWLFSSCLGSHVGDFMGGASELPKEIQSHSKLSVLLTLEIFLLSVPQCSLRLGCTSCTINISLGTRPHI